MVLDICTKWGSCWWERISIWTCKFNNKFLKYSNYCLVSRIFCIV